MLRIVPKWRISWTYQGIDKWFVIYIHACSSMEVTEWFNKINHGLLILEKLEFLAISPDNLEQSKIEV